MLSLVSIVLAQLVGPSLTSPVVSCDNIPSWSISNFTVSFGGGQGQNLPAAKASFTISGGLSGGKSDHLTCTMRANSHCQIDGIPSDKNCHVYIQTYLDEYIVTINETISCDGKPSVKYLVGQGRLPLDCPSNADPDPGAAKTCKGDSGVVMAGPPE